MHKEPRFSWCTTITNEQNNPRHQRKSWREGKNFEGHTVHNYCFFSHMIPDYTRLSLTKVHKRGFVNEIDSFGLQHLWSHPSVNGNNTWHQGKNIDNIHKYIKIKTYRCKWGIYNSKVIWQKINNFGNIKCASFIQIF